MDLKYPPQVVHSETGDEVADDDGDQEHHEDHDDLDDHREGLSKTSGRHLNGQVTSDSYMPTYHLVLRYVIEGEVVCKVVFPDHHDQHFEEACPGVVKHFFILGEHDEEDHAKSDEGRYVNHEELDQLVDHLIECILDK